jgi:lipopolysaccharide cholinephosphotransferase
MLEIRFANLPNPRLRNRLLTRWVRPLLSGKLINHLYNIIARGVSVESASRVRNMFLVYGERRETCDAGWFAKPVYLNFENGSYPVPSDPDAYLRHVYGDYMVLPPFDQRKNNHATIVDLDHGTTR